MLPQKELLPLTGYVHGGCSPVGMKSNSPTVFHATAADLPTIMVSAGPHRPSGNQFDPPTCYLQPRPTNENIVE